MILKRHAYLSKELSSLVIGSRRELRHVFFLVIEYKQNVVVPVFILRRLRLLTFIELLVRASA